MISKRRLTTLVSLLFLIIIGCKTSGIKSMNMNDFNSISKWYAKKNGDYLRRYKSFEIWRESVDSLGLAVYYVFPNINPFAPSLNEKSLGMLPTHFTKINGNVFFWRENKSDMPPDEVVKELNAIGLLDSTYIKVDLGMIRTEDAVPPALVTDERIKTAKYVVCKNTGKIKYELFSAYALNTEMPKFIDCN